MSVEVGERVSLLGGARRRRGLFSHYSGWQLTGRVAAGTAGLVVLVVTKSPWLLGLFVAVALVVARYDQGGPGAREARVDRWRLRVGGWTGANVFDPVVSLLPRELGAVEFLAVDTDTDAALALTRDGADYVAVLEVTGGGEGIRAVAETNRRGVAHGRLLHALAGGGNPVTQIDVETRVIPVSSASYEAWLAGRLRSGLPGPVQASMAEGVAAMAEHGEAYRSFVTVRLSGGALATRLLRRRASVDEESLAAEAFEATRETARRLERAGYQVVAGLGPRRLGAYIRHLYTPHHGVDDIDGIESPLDGFTGYVNTDPGLHCPAEPGGEGSPEWWHAVATVPRDGWPQTEVGMRLLEPVVLGVSPATLRSVKVQYVLVPKRVAIERSVGALVMNKAVVIGHERAQRETSGEDATQVDATARVLEDLVERDAAGVEPVVRVMVSAPSVGELEEARDRVDAALQDAGFGEWAWHDGRHHHGLAVMLPLAKGVKRS